MVVMVFVEGLVGVGVDEFFSVEIFINKLSGIVFRVCLDQP
jgi:hypothetical protein